MVWTKDEIDKYVIQVERNCKSAHERNLKGFAFARLYREAADNESAKRYLEAYISESEGDFRGHCLMGQLYESMGQLEKAVASYRRSLELNNTQKELVLKVVKLYCSVAVHPDRARAWADRGARLFPGHPDVFHLRLHLLESAEVVDYEALEDLISEEVSKRPRDIDLHIRLVRLYAVKGRLDEAFSHCAAVWKTKAFKDSLEWVACCVEMVEKYLTSHEKSIKGEVIGSGNAILDVHAFLLIILCQFMELQLRESNTREVINALYRLDHSLFMAHRHRIRQSARHSASGGPTEWSVILTEIKAQLYMHCGTLLIRLAKENFVTWPRGLKLACACYLASVSISEPETKTPWVARAPKNKDPLKWYVMACSRLSQVGHFLMATGDRHGAIWMNTCHSDCCSRQGLQEILNTIYRDERDLTKSFLVYDGEFTATELMMPAVEQLVSWDEVALSENPRNLQNITWVGLHWYKYNKEMRPGVGVMVKDIFQELRLDVPNIEKHITPNMLCLRDIEAFVYAVVRTTAARVLEDRDIFYEDYEPQVLPQSLCSSLSLPVQNEWWIAAYNLYTGKFSLNESGKIRHTVQLGIEKIRAVDEKHGLQVRLLIYLGNSFGSKANYLKGSGENPWYYEEHWKSLEKWSMHYLRKALAVLEKLEKDESIPRCEKPLFPHMFDTLLGHEVKCELQSVRLALGGTLMKEGKLFDAMEMFEQVKTPPGLFNLAQAYKYLAHVEACAATEETDTESASPTKEYYQNLQEARGLLQSYLKMTDPSDVGRKAVIDELNDIERLIRTGLPRASSASGQHGDVHQSTYLETQSSTDASDVQESDDNFWVEQPPDPNTKDFIATLSEVALNKGYFQEQMAIRDEAMSKRDETITSMREEINMLMNQVSMLQLYSTLNTPPCPSPGTGDQSKPMFESTPLTSKQMPLTGSGKPLAQPNIKRPLKIDSNFFAGLSSSNSPEKRVDEPEEPAVSPTSPGRSRHDSSTSYTEDIHFEPLIPLPEQIEVHTGEEEEEVLFSSRAKLYRYDKDVSAWKDRGIGIMKILHNAVKGRSRILMRREVVHKICANHFITADMKLEEKKGATNSLIWSTLADYSEEVLKPEQLAVKFKTQEEVLLFKETFEECQKMLKEGAKVAEHTADTNDKSSNLMAKFAPKPGLWSCPICLVSNEEHTTVCVACGAAKLTEGGESTVAPAMPMSGFQLPKDLTPSSAPHTISSSSGGPFVFKMSDTQTLSSSPFTATSQASSGAPSPFTFGAPTSAASTQTSTVFGASSEAPETSKPATSQPFVLAAFGVPAINSKSSQPTFPFGTSSLTGSSPFSFSATEQAANTTPPETSVFGGGSPEHEGDPTVSFGSFGTGTSPRFDLDVSNHSTSSTQTDPLKCDKCDNDQITQQPNTSEQYQFTENQPQSSFSFSMPSENPNIPTQQLFWQQPTGSFQFGQLESIPPLGGVTSGAANVNNFWFQTTPPPVFEPSTSQLESALQTPGTFSFTCQQGFAPNSNVDFSSSEFLRLLAAANEQQDFVKQDYQSRGYNFAPYVVDEPPEDIFLHGETKPLSSAITDEYDSEHEGGIEESEKYTDDSSNYSDDDEEDTEASLLSAQKPPPSSEIKPSFSPSKADVVTPPLKPVPVHSTQVETSAPAQPSQPTTALRRFLVAKSALKGAKKQDEDCVIVYEVRASIADREKATCLFLPPNFFSYTKHEACPGCFGCLGVSKEVAGSTSEKQDKESKAADVTANTTENATKPSPNTSSSHVFGQSASFGQLTFSSLVQNSNAFPQTQKKDSHKPFQGAGTQLFADSSKRAEGQDEDQLHFEPVIPLPEEIQVVTGEEGLEVLFSERAKLYRFDADSGQWKERGVGEVKLLRHPTSGRGRVLMRREQIKKLCANHNITAAMELKPNIGSDRSWVWYTSADYAEGEARPEKLAVKLKTPEIAEKFKQVFDDIKELSFSEHPPETAEAEDQKEKTGCELYGQFISTFTAAPGASWSCEVCYVENKVDDSICIACNVVKPGAQAVEPYSQFISTFTAAPGASWSCEVCYVENKVDDSICIACNAVKPGAQVVEPSSTTGEDTATKAAVESEEPIAFQDSNKTEAPAGFVFQSPAGKGPSSAQLFTIGRVDPGENLADDEFETSPYKTSSPSKQGVSPPQKPSTPSKSAQEPAGTPSKFTFSLVVSPRSPTRQTKSPSPLASPQSPECPVHGGDDGPHFEPVIPLPEKVECRTGEEGQEVLFCERCKLFRYDGDTSQWKERGIGDIKILLNPTSGKYRVLMRREQIFKLCANHLISANMELKPFTNSDRAWLWTTLADFSEEESAAETLAVRFRTSEVASQFKETFDKALQVTASESDNPESSIEPEVKESSQPITYKADNPESSTETEVKDSSQPITHKADNPESSTEPEVKDSSQPITYQADNTESSTETEVKDSSQPITYQADTPESSTEPEVKDSSQPITYQADNTESSTEPEVKDSSQPITYQADTPESSTEPEVKDSSQPITYKADNTESSTEPEVKDSSQPITYQAGTPESSTEPEVKDSSQPITYQADTPESSTEPEVKDSSQPITYQAGTPESSTEPEVKDSSQPITYQADTPESSTEPEVKDSSQPITYQAGTPESSTEPEVKDSSQPITYQAGTPESSTEPEVKDSSQPITYKADITESSTEPEVKDYSQPITYKADITESSTEPEVKDYSQPITYKADITESSTEPEVKDYSQPITYKADITESSTEPEVKDYSQPITYKADITESSTEPEVKDSSQPIAYKADNTESSPNPTEKQSDQATGQDVEEEISIVFEKEATDAQKERAQRLELPNNFFGYEETTDGTNPDESTASEQDHGTPNEDPEVKPAAQNFLFGFASVASLSFQSVAASSLSNSPFGKKTPDKSPGFVGAGSRLFAVRKTDDNDDDDTTGDDHHVGPHFEPIIPLPDKIDVKTGEENEEVMFCHRAKLYRFVAEDKQWKERGVGDIKLLRNNLTGKMRVLMRREQVLKLCANHHITTDMKLMPNAGSERSWVWSTAADFSEGCKAERLAVRFKNEDIAKQFKEKFEECQEIQKNQASLNLSIQEEAAQEEKGDEDLLAKFKAAEGSWECDACLVRNDSDKVECAACGTPKPGVEISEEKKTYGNPVFGSSTTPSGTKFSFGAATPSSGSGITFGSGGAGFTFGSAGSSGGGAKPLFTFGSLNQTPSFGPLNQEGKATEDQTEEKEKDEGSESDKQTDDGEEVEQPVTEEEACGPSDEAPAGDGDKEDQEVHSDTSSPVKQDVEDSEEKKEEKFLFGSSNISSLSFQSVAASSIGTSPFGQKTNKRSPGFAGAGSKLFTSQSPGGDEHEAEHEGDNEGPHFEPIIPLPNKIEVKTGEENEEVMFCHRAKLYRFVAEDKQWKERGVGDIKLLRNNLTGKMRVLMRREQVLKLCANHHITNDMKLMPNAGSERSWVWSTAADFSEEGCKAERLAVRFKNEDIAKQFKEKFEECQEILKTRASLKLSIQEEAAQEEKGDEDLLAKFKAAEGSWECDACLVRNDSDKVECAACGSLKGGVEATQVPSSTGRPLFGSGLPTSGAGFTFGSAAPSAGEGFSFGSIPASGFAFGSTGQSSSENPFASFGSQKQTPSFSPSNFTFGSLNQTPSSSVTKAEETVQSETKAASDDQEEKVLPARQEGERGPEGGVSEMTNAEEGVDSKPDESSNDTHPEERVPLSSEKQPVENISEENGIDQSDSVGEGISQLVSDVQSLTGETQDGSSDSSSCQPNPNQEG